MTQPYLEVPSIYKTGSLVYLFPDNANGIVNGTPLEKIGRPVRDVELKIKELSVNQAWAAAYLS